jgi:hypothetical protein
MSNSGVRELLFLRVLSSVSNSAPVQINAVVGRECS